MNNRFEVIYREGSILKDVGKRYILVDKQTGVQYLLVGSGYGCSITPLLGKDGKPITKNVTEQAI